MGLFGKAVEEAGGMAAIANPLVGGAIGLVGKVLDNLYPDPQQRAAAQDALMRLKDGAEARELDALVKQQAAQATIDNTEAASENSFKSCWRPFLGWICGVSLAYAWLVQPLLVWLSQNAGWDAPPTLSVQEQMAVVMQMMGLAGARTIEKLQSAQ